MSVDWVRCEVMLPVDQPAMKLYEMTDWCTKSFGPAYDKWLFCFGTDDIIFKFMEEEYLTWFLLKWHDGTKVN